jgi:hypothetical protein
MTMTATDFMQRDNRFRKIVDLAIHKTISSFDTKLPTDDERFAYEVATMACAEALAMAFNDDAELRAARDERDWYKQIAEKALYLSPAPMFVVTDLDIKSQERQS